MTFRIKTVSEVLVNPFNLLKAILYGEITVTKPKGDYYLLEIFNYYEIISEEGGTTRVPLRGNLSNVPYKKAPVRVSYELYDALIGQIGASVQFPTSVVTEGSKRDFIALIAMMMINNGQMPEPGETELFQLCGSEWVLDL